MGVNTLLFSILIGLSAHLEKIGYLEQQKKIKIPWNFSLILSLLSSIACLSGGLTSHHMLHRLLPAISHLFGSALLTTIGVWILLHTLISHYTETQPFPNQLGFDDMMIMCTTEFMADLAIGFGTGFSGFNVFFIAIAMGFFCFFCILTPTRWISLSVPLQFREFIPILSGFLLITMGLLQ